MDIQSAFSAGLQGFNRASAGVTEATLNLNRQTQQIRQNETEQAASQAQASEQAAIASRQQPSLTDSLVQLGQEERNAQANARSVQTADEVLGTVIDIRV